MEIEICLFLSPTRRLRRFTAPAELANAFPDVLDASGTRYALGVT